MPTPLLQRSVFASFGELALGFAPALEVTLDNLAFGASARQRLTRNIDMSDPGIASGLRAELFTDRRDQLTATTSDELLGELEPGLCNANGHELVPHRTGSGEGLARGLGLSPFGIEPGVRFARIADGSCEISASDPLVALTSLADRS